jgi:hypothetical protein
LSLDYILHGKRKNREVTNSFETISTEWFVLQNKTWTTGHACTVKGRLERDISPWLSRPMEEIIFYDDHALEYFDPDHSREKDRFILLGMSSTNQAACGLSLLPGK